MSQLIVIANKLNRRSAPVTNFDERSNITGIVTKGFTFESTCEINNNLGSWYGDAFSNFYWAGGLAVNITSIQANRDSVKTTGAIFSSSVQNNLKPDTGCFDFIKQHEGFRLKAYQDSAGIWTIGYGAILYEDNTPVKKDDVITAGLAEHLLQIEIEEKSIKVTAALSGTHINQQQYNALVSFAFNAGTGALLVSTLLKKVKANPADITIRDAFMAWDKAHVDGMLNVVPGLKKRREDEANLYFS